MGAWTPLTLYEAKVKIGYAPQRKHQILTIAATNISEALSHAENAGEVISITKSRTPNNTSSQVWVPFRG